jgi:hypothetical protein
MAEDYELPERLVTEALIRDLNAGKVGNQAQQAQAEAALHCTAATGGGAAAAAAAAVAMPRQCQRYAVFIQCRP